MRSGSCARIMGALCTTSLVFVLVYITATGSRRKVILMSSNKEVTGGTMLSELSRINQERKTFKNMSIPSGTAKHDPKSRLNVILYGKHRTGSTFAGEMFNKHHDFYITFEPLNFLYIEQVIDHGLKVINDSLHCSFVGLNQTNRPSRKHWVMNNVFCQYGNQTRGCPRVNLKAVESYCQLHRHVATKLIVIRHIESLEKLMAQGVKVVQLVRDPRGVINSRKPYVANLKSTIGAYETAEIYCQNMMMDLAYMRTRRQLQPSSTDSAYYVLRYEDLASSPMATIQRVYRFLGVEPDVHLEKWARDVEGRNTHRVQGARVREASFGTKRNNPVSTSQAWRRKLTPQDITLIQDACRPMMEVLGYRSVDTPSQLSDAAFNPLLPFNFTAFLR